MRIVGLGLSILLILIVSHKTDARDIRASWDNRCEECHGDVDTFAAKYLWAVDGKLQGRHHVDNIRLYLSRHYTPKHELDATYDLLLSQANNPVRFRKECGSCHGEAEQFVRRSINGKGEEISGVGSGMAIKQFLETHENLKEDDVVFFMRLLIRVKDQIGRKP